jgi:hypothetical protein
VTSHPEPETSEELWTYLNTLKEIGDITGTDVFIANVKSRYCEKKHKAPNEEEIILMQYFINGNKKK